MIITDKKYLKENFIHSDERIAGEFVHPNELLQGYSPNLVRDSWRLIGKRKRWVVQKGVENVSILLDDIVLFYTEGKIVFVVDQLGQKYIAEETLTVLEEKLDHTIFFRANRQFIISINYIRSFRAHERVKLKVNINLGELSDRYSIIISQETAPAFREWIYAA